MREEPTARVDRPCGALSRQATAENGVREAGRSTDLDERKLTSRLEDWRAVWEVIRSITSTLEVQETLQRVLHGIQEILGYRRAALGLVNQPRRREEIKLSVGWPAENVKGVVWPLQGDRIWELLVARGQPILIDAARFPDLPEGIRQMFSGPFWKVPLVSKGDLIGSIMADAADASEKPGDVELLATLSEAAAIAVENAQLYYDVLRSREELQQAQDRLVEAERLAVIGQLAAGINHEINNPLCTIAMSTQLLRQECRRKAPELLERIDVIDAAVERIMQVTRKVAELKRSKTKEYLPQKEMLDLS